MPLDSSTNLRSGASVVRLLRLALTEGVRASSPWDQKKKARSLRFSAILCRGPGGSFNVACCSSLGIGGSKVNSEKECQAEPSTGCSPSALEEHHDVLPKRMIEQAQSGLVCLCRVCWSDVYTSETPTEPRIRTETATDSAIVQSGGFH